MTIDPLNSKFNSIIYANRGLAYQKLKKHTEAIADFDKSIELNPNYFKPYLRRGDSRNDQGDFEAA